MKFVTRDLNIDMEIREKKKLRTVRDHILMVNLAPLYSKTKPLSGLA